MISLFSSLTLAIIVIFSSYSYAGDTEVQYRLARQCAVDAEKYYNKVWSPDGRITNNADGSQTQSGFYNHYSRSLNECYAVMEAITTEKTGRGSFMRNVININDNNTVGGYFDHDMTQVTTCYVGDAHCKTRDEFDALLKKYMEY
jgi:hypothetical protein